MATGLIALLDDVAAIARLAAASLDDVAAASTKAGVKAAGVVIDDAAVTPGYVVGLTPDRELPIIGKITLGSLRNKLLFLLPAALAISSFAPWLLDYLLILGGSYLCFEAAEKVWEALTGTGHESEDHVTATDPATLEKEQVAGAIRTDLILSGEIMAIALSAVAAEPIWKQAVVLAVVAVAITIGVYGAVAIIVKMDDVGLHLARKPGAAARRVGAALVHGMSYVLQFLSVVGTAAMAWVGGQIVLHALERTLWPAPGHAVHHVSVAAGHASPVAPAVIEWICYAALAGLFGLALGAVIVVIMHLLPRKA